MMELLTLAAIRVCAVLLASATIAQAPIEVRWAQERLSVRASDAPLADVVQAVSRHTGIEVVGGERLRGRVSVDVTDLPPEQALARILVGVNYLLRERRNAGDAAGRLILTVHSMVGATADSFTFTGPLSIPALDALVAEEAADARDEKEVEAEDRIDDPDAEDESRLEQLQASRLAAQGAFRPEAPLATVLEYTNSPNEWIRIEALKALASRSLDPALPALMKALGDESWDARGLAVQILGGATDDRSLHAIGEQLERNGDRDVRLSAMRVLALRGEPRALPYLTRALGDEDERLREAAAQLITQLERRARLRQEYGAK